jgi:plasmid maintenance system killer protein
MIIKFREDRISKLEHNHPLTSDDNAQLVTDLKKEIQMWKDAADHNS